MIKQLLYLFLMWVCIGNCAAQRNEVNFDAVDSLIETTPELDMCLKDGKEDLRFFYKTPEKYSDYKQQFAKQAAGVLVFEPNSHFVCDVSVEVNCKGQAGNYDFAIEPRTFSLKDFEYFKQLIGLVNQLKSFAFKPAHYLGEDVNSKVKFRLAAKDGKAVVQ